MNIIYLVNKTVESYYKILQKRIEGSTYLTYSEDIVSPIVNQYKDILSNVEIKDNFPSYLKASYSASCKNSKGMLVHDCKNVALGEKVDFKAKIKVRKE